MFFTPKNTKFNKFQKNKIRHIPSSNLNLVYGVFALKAKNNGYLTVSQLNTLQLQLVRGTKKLGQYWIRVFPHVSITSKPLEVRMGKGKGYIATWIAKVKIGSIICEISGLSFREASILLKKISLKLPFTTLFIKKY